MGIFVKIKKNHPLISLSKICSLHKPCQKEYRCTAQQKTEVIDFDAYKNKIDRSLKSVDAVYISNDNSKVLLIEIKGWEDYIFWNKSITKQKIDKKIKEYALSKKYIDSSHLLLDLINTDKILTPNEINLLIESSEWWFVLITDIDTKENNASPIKQISQGLQHLSVTSSSINIREICNNSTEEYIKNLVFSKNYKHTQSKIWSCKDFDKKIALI